MATRKPRRVAPSPLNLEVLIERIQERMKALGTNALQVAIQAGIGQSYVSDLVSAGKNQNPKLGAIQAIARVLDCDLAYLAGEQPTPRRRASGGSAGDIPVIGYAEAGPFSPMADFDQENHQASDFEHQSYEFVTAAYDPKHPTARHFALRIRGDSMNASNPPIVEGHIVLCVDFEDSGLDIESNRIYAVRRTDDDGQKWECTIKRARVFRDRYELIPESTNPIHKPLIIPRTSQAESRDVVGHRIEVFGLVYKVEANAP